ncbi:MAG: AAA family ATPase [Lachnospiraceae bacterium]|nr:AAA family ATPase [Lachnospiraceae bacterium]
MRYMNSAAAAEQWKMTERRVTMLCREGKISGAKKEGKYWLIPETARRPEDGRKTAGKTWQDTGDLKPLPIGISDFKKAVTSYYYVDKTLLLRDFLDAIPQVSLFTRPRRFGKTLTMDMLRTFFEISEEDTSIYFTDKKIWTCGTKYQEYQGKYPVIYVTFKDVKCETWEAAYEYICRILRNEFERHSELLDSGKISSYEKKYLTGVLEGDAGETDIAMAFLNLSRMLHVHHGVAPIIIIDEYDTPIQQGYVMGYYDKVVGFMRTLFSGGFKDNPHLSFGFMTGILRVAKESIFSGMNNLKVNSIMEERFSEYFGFTADEVKEMLAYYGHGEKFDEICEWYDGYRFGNTEIFNPWSVLNYLDEACTPKAFWQSTGDNSFIRKIISGGTEEIFENLQQLLQGKNISSYVDTSVIYPEIENNPASVYSFLLSAGYLKAVTTEFCFDGNNICNIAVPNKEIFYVYEKEIISAFSGHFKQATAISIKHALLKRNMSEFQKHLEDFLIQSISSFDYAHENFYHGLMLGIYAVMNNIYQVTSNRESGAGRYDIQMKPLDKRLPGLLLELKVPQEKIDESQIAEKLEELSRQAIGQMETKQYAMELQQDGIQKIMKIGVAFYKKQVKVAFEE